MVGIDQKRIAKNTLMLYIRMGVVMMVNLYASRVILAALGKVDFGIYGAVGSIVQMCSFLSVTMSTACQRFYSFEIGRGNFDRLRRCFSQTIIVFIVIALIVVLLSESAGMWFLENKMQLAGRTYAAHYVFQLSIVSFIFQIMRIPYMGMVIAKEKMKVFAYISVFEALGSLTISLLLKYSHHDRLILYAWLMLTVQIMTTLAFYLYCRIFYVECRVSLKYDRAMFRQVFSFTGWEMIGSLAGVCKTYGVNLLLLNPFFGPVINAARDVANKVYSTILQLQTNFFMAVKPQLIKSYADGKVDDMIALMCQSLRLTYYLLLVVAIPILVETPMILDIWLEDVPEYAPLFARLLIVNGLIDTFSNPLASAIQATGRNKWYQICMGSTLLAIVPIGYAGFKWLDWNAEAVFYVSIVLSVAAQCVRVYFVRKQIELDVRMFMRQVVYVILLVTSVCVALPLLVKWLFEMSDDLLSAIIVMAVSMMWTAIVVYFIGITGSERKYVNGFVKKYIGFVICRR
ncbi:MAG: lipopolysaccharide biosynthesis protein [Bacteroidaceae bacterium]|nr:lipopolysaccharide biosynthesis protein [Bacteroidaceae bacterium]